MGENLITLTKTELETIYQTAAFIGADTAIKTIKDEQKNLYKKTKDKKLHNTKLLLRNYYMLKENANNSVFGQCQMKESAADILNSMMNLYDDDVIVDAIKRSATRTAIIVAHIRTMLDIYKSYCEKSLNKVEKRRYNILYDMYIADRKLSVKEIAKKNFISKESVYCDLNMAVERLSALLFGIDGIK